MDICYVFGDATQTQGIGARIIVHVCNDLGRWGKGFVLALWSRGQAEAPFALGQVQFVEVEPALWVANVLGQ